MAFAVAFDFQSRRAETIRPEEATDRVECGWFCWLVLEPAEISSSLPTSAPVRREDISVIESPAPDDIETTCAMDPDAVRLVLQEAIWQENGLQTAAVNVALNDRWLVIVQREPTEFVRQMMDTYREDFLRFSLSPGFLLFEMAQSLLETQRRARRRLAAEIERLHDHLLEAADELMFDRVSRITHDLLHLRKVVLDTAEVFHELSVRRSPFVPESTRPHVGSTAEAMQRVGEDLSVQRDTINDAVTLYMGAVGHRTNKVVKRLTIVGTIFMPLTFLCGVYGMNMKIPEIEWKWMYLTFWLISFAVTAGQLWMMRKWKWF